MGSQNADIIAVLNTFRKNNISFFPLFPSTKVPIIKHEDYYTREPNEEELKEWLKTYFNPNFWREVWEKDGKLKVSWINALKTEFNKIGRKIEDYKYEGEINIAVAGGYNRLTLIDIEDITKIIDPQRIDPVKFFAGYGFVVVKTGKPNGYHLWCLSEWKENVKGENGEIRVFHQYVVAPPSRHPNGQYYQFLSNFELQEVSVAFIKSEVLRWIEAKEQKEDVKAPSVLWESIRSAAALPVVHGKRSDWVFVLTMFAKSLLKDERKAFEELLSIPIVKSKVTRDGSWDEERAYEWWKKYEWDACENSSVFSAYRALKWAEKQTGLSLNVDETIRSYFEITREKGYGYLLSETDIVAEVARILDSCIEVEEDEDGRVDYYVRKDYIHIISRGINYMFYFTAIQEFDELYMYVDGIYKPCEFWLKKILQLAWDVSNLRSMKPLTKTLTDEIIAALKRLNYISIESFEDRSCVNVKNGIIDLADMMLKPHTPEKLFLTQINACYNKNDEEGKEIWESFLREVASEKYIPVLQEFIGYCLLKDCRFEKALALIGPGGSGKSTFLEAIRATLGSDNVTAFSIQQLENERFARAELVGKLANIYNDLPYDALEKSDMFKQLVSGDAIQVEKKYRQPFLAKIHTKLIFSANQLPPTKDMSTAFFRRWIIIPFNKVIDNPDPMMKEKLKSDKVRNYVLKWALEGLKRLLSQGRFSYDMSVEEIAEFYEEASDTVSTFIKQHVEKDSGAKIKKSELYHLYTEFCKENGFPPVSLVQFSRRIRAFGAGEKRRDGYPYWVGIRYVDSKEEEENKVESQLPDDIDSTRFLT